jgi:hypothetical protein
MASRKDEWDKIRRRALAQIGWRKGHARAKRRALGKMRVEDIMSDKLHKWSRDLVEWCVAQGVGMVRVDNLGTGDWPAFKFIEQVKSKAAEYGIAVEALADVRDGGGMRAMKAVTAKEGKQSGKRRHALREIAHQIKAGIKTGVVAGNASA